MVQGLLHCNHTVAAQRLLQVISQVSRSENKTSPLTVISMPRLDPATATGGDNSDNNG